MQLPSEIRFADESFKQSLDGLAAGTSEEQQLCREINHSFDSIAKNAFSGIQIAKRLIPKEYVVLYDVKNLWKYNLSRGWRVLYSIKKEELLIISVVLEWLNHKNYERKFKY